MMKFLAFCFLVLTNHFLVADAKVQLNSVELSKAAETVVKNLTQNLLKQHLQDVSNPVSLISIQLKEFRTSSPDITQEGSVITLALYGVSIKLEATWGSSDNGVSLTASTKASVRLTVQRSTGSDGRLSVDCVMYVSEFNIGSKETINDLDYSLLISAFKKVKADLQIVVCQWAKDIISNGEAKDVFIKYLTGPAALVT